MAAAFGLVATLGFGAVSANAGILVSDKNSNQQCAPVKSNLLNQFAGILIVGAPMLDGIIMVGRDGILVSDKGCESKDGIIIVGRDGILVSD